MSKQQKDSISDRIQTEPLICTKMSRSILHLRNVGFIVFALLALGACSSSKKPLAKAIPTPYWDTTAGAPPAARIFLVFFDWNKSNPRPEWIKNIALAASESRSGNTTVVVISGYTDSSGSRSFNQQLSNRRAETVAKQLEADGVSDKKIQIHGYGSDHQLEPTGPNVSKEQNRRVQIDLE